MNPCLRRLCLVWLSAWGYAAGVAPTSLRRDPTPLAERSERAFTDRPFPERPALATGADEPADASLKAPASTPSKDRAKSDQAAALAATPNPHAETSGANHKSSESKLPAGVNSILNRGMNGATPHNGTEVYANGVESSAKPISVAPSAPVSKTQSAPVRDVTVNELFGRNSSDISASGPVAFTADQPGPVAASAKGGTISPAATTPTHPEATTLPVTPTVLISLQEAKTAHAAVVAATLPVSAVPLQAEAPAVGTAAAVQSMEDTVAELLRPMLRQWLTPTCLASWKGRCGLS